MAVLGSADTEAVPGSEEEEAVSESEEEEQSEERGSADEISDSGMAESSSSSDTSDEEDMLVKINCFMSCNSFPINLTSRTGVYSIICANSWQLGCNMS